MIKKVLAYCCVVPVLSLTVSEVFAYDYSSAYLRTIYNYTDEDINIRWSEDTNRTQGCVLNFQPGVDKCVSHQDVNFFIPKSSVPSRDGVTGTPSAYPIIYVAEGNSSCSSCDVQWNITGHMLYVNKAGELADGFGAGKDPGEKSGPYLRGSPTWVDEKINDKDIRIVANAFGLGGNVMICYKGKPPCTNYAERTVFNNTDVPVQI